METALTDQSQECVHTDGKMESSPWSPPRTLWEHCRESPDAIALVEVGGRSWSRGEMSAISARIRNRLLAVGVSDSDAVAIIAPNCAEFMLAYLGVTLLGASAVPVNFHLTGDEIAHILRTSRACTILVHHSLLEKIDRIRRLVGPHPPETLVISACMGDPDLQDPPLHQCQAAAPLPRHLGRAMVFTSATTGKPKAVSYRRDNGYADLEKRIAFREVQGTHRNSGAVHFCASMLYHVGPLEGAVVTLHMGNTLVLMRTWDVRVALRAIAEHRVTEAFLVPIMIVQLAKIPDAERANYDLASLRMLIHAGAPCPMDAKRRVIEWRGPFGCEGYGPWEGGGTFVSSAEWLRFPGTVGRAIPGAEISIRTPAGAPLPSGKEGFIYMRAYTGDRFEYLGDPEGTTKCFVGDQFTVGDIGYLNEEGYLFILDRAANMIICGGANIYPAEVEAVLCSHGAVIDCAVVGKPDEMFGETVHAVIQVSPDCGMSEAQLRADLVRFACARLAPSKLPRTIEFVGSIPRDPNGKMIKRRIFIPPDRSGPAIGDNPSGDA